MSSIASAVRTAWRCGLPAGAAALAWWLAVRAPPGAHDAALLPARVAHAFVLATLLLCPGWGLLRLLSRVDRRFGIAGGALCLSLLLLGLAGRAGAGLTAHALFAASLALALAGGARQAQYDRWSRSQPRHPSPMPVWPDELRSCLALLALALAAVSSASFATIPTSPTIPAAEGISAAADGAVGPVDLFADTVATLARVGRLGESDARQLVAAACLAAVLLFAAEGISRLRGNRGAALAMLAVLLAYQPLGMLLALAGSGSPPSPPLAADAVAAAAAEGTLGGALRPFLEGTPLALSLALVAMLLSATLSVLRRSSHHVPRLAAAAAFGLVLSLPAAAFVLLPGWLLGVWWAHRMCRAIASSDPAAVATERRPGEPALLRAPFWALAVPIAGAGALAFGLSGAGLPDAPSAAAIRVTMATLLVAVFPCAVLLVPGVRQLNASPGREAYLFLGLVLGALLASLLWALPADEFSRLLGVILAVPVANGALELLDRHGRRARIALLLGSLMLLPGVLLLVRSASSP